MKLHLPTYLGGDTLDLNTEIDADEHIIGWINDLGTIYSSRVNVIIGDIVVSEQGQWAALILKRSYEYTGS